MLRITLLLLILMPLGGCYYMQAAAGQWEVLRKREPVAEVIEDPATPPPLKAKLALLQTARDFSVSELGLPDNESYRTYVDLQRDYVLWNVFAVRELAFEPKRWCFPVAGCVNYRGHFVRERAQREADRLRRDGYDVLVGGIAAYSTLGNFSDPILSTMVNWEDTRVVAVLFHELAHQVLYVKDDSTFNESFATAVEEFGVRRWLESRGETALFDAYVERRRYRQSQMTLIADARDELEVVYSRGIDDDEKRQRKAARLRQLVSDLAALADESGRDASAWDKVTFNNANLMSVSLYEGRVEFFRGLFAECASDFDCFYAVAAERAGREPGERYAPQ